MSSEHEYGKNEVLTAMITTSDVHNLVAKMEDRYKKHLEAQADYFKAREELREAINGLAAAK